MNRRRAVHLIAFLKNPKKTVYTASYCSRTRQRTAVDDEQRRRGSVLIDVLTIQFYSTPVLQSSSVLSFYVHSTTILHLPVSLLLHLEV